MRLDKPARKLSEASAPWGGRARHSLRAESAMNRIRIPQTVPQQECLRRLESARRATPIQGRTLTRTSTNLSRDNAFAKC